MGILDLIRKDVRAKEIRQELARLRRLVAEQERELTLYRLKERTERKKADARAPSEKKSCGISEEGVERAKHESPRRAEDIVIIY